MAIPECIDALLNRDQTAAALTEAGYPTKPKTLATKATRGGGPPFRRFGRMPLYRWGDSLTWAESRLGPLLRSTAEADVVKLNREKAEAPTDAQRGNPVSTPRRNSSAGQGTGSADGNTEETDQRFLAAQTVKCGVRRDLP